jgi:hypothetical protein
MLGSHIYYTNSFSAWQISGNDIKNVSMLILALEKLGVHIIFAMIVAITLC